MIGPGKYDDICTKAREATNAEGAILLIFNGEHGQGFSCQLPPHLMPAVPSMLRYIADEIDANPPLTDLAQSN